MKFRLRDADQTLRLFLTSFIVVLTLGYCVGLFFVEHTTSLSPDGLSQEFGGSETVDDADEMKFAKSSHEMYVFIHNHVLGLTLVFFGLGSVFYFSSITSELWKRMLLVEPMAAIVTTFGGIALVRFVWPGFRWLVIVSGLSLFMCYIAISYLILRELWKKE